MFIFSTAPGVAVSYSERPGVPSSLRIDGLSSGANQPVVVTDIGMARRVNFQAMHTLGDAIHVYPFGEKIADIVIGGVLFEGNCGRTSRGGMAGANQIVDFFNRNNLAARDRPITVTVGRQAARGLLVGLDVKLVDTETNFGRFQLELKVAPPPARRVEVDDEAEAEEGFTGFATS